MLKKDRYRHLIEYFSEKFPTAETELSYANPYELLVAVILSAQCTDKRVNQITPALFERFPTPESLAASTAEEVFTYIRSVSYPNNKSKHLVGMARMLVNDYGSEVPASIDELQKMPGVGRKTANVIASVIFNQPAMAVDTHVFRTSHRLGLVPAKATTPLAVEKELVKHIPQDLVARAHHWLILHGRYVCVARNPKCTTCELTPFCKYFEKLTKGQKITEVPY
ncbi:MAG: endonuclease III [Spirosomataceae bacterium]